MRRRTRLDRLERTLQAENFCPDCETVSFADADEPAHRPPICPRCVNSCGIFDGSGCCMA